MNACAFDTASASKKTLAVTPIHPAFALEPLSPTGRGQAPSRDSYRLITERLTPAPGP
jgi:hypothetical protein